MQAADLVVFAPLDPVMGSVPSLEHLVALYEYTNMTAAQATQN